MGLFTRQPAPTGLLTADRRNIVLTIDKDALLAHGGDEGGLLLAALAAINPGDWGGTDYPERPLAANDVITLLPLLLKLAPDRKSAVA